MLHAGLRRTCVGAMLAKLSSFLVDNDAGIFLLNSILDEICRRAWEDSSHFPMVEIHVGQRRFEETEDVLDKIHHCA